MKLLYDSAMPYGEEFFSSVGDAQAFQAGQLRPKRLKGIDALLVRSTTRVDSALLKEADQLRFVGTATAGFDHFDMQALKEANVQAYVAAGCNAVAVAEYVISTLLKLAAQDQFSLQDKTLAIVGAGKVGSALAALAGALNISHVLYDPPLQKAGDTRDFVSFEEVLQADIISLHTPLVTQPPTPTLHMFGQTELAQLRADQYLINACRGEVIDNAALLALFAQGKQLNVVLDVWENEPQYNPALCAYLRFATAHIAGHSLEGKARGTQMVYQALCEHMGLAAPLCLADFLPEHKQTFYISNAAQSPEKIGEIVWEMYDIAKDDSVFRSHMAKSPNFTQIRKEYWPRREFSAAKLVFSQETNELSLDNKKWRESILALGFKLANDSY